jgi:hypothetical protein
MGSKGNILSPAVANSLTPSLARVVELADTGGLNPPLPSGGAGSIPAPGTTPS